MKLARYYKNATLYPSITVIVLILIYSVIENRNYKSEWLTSDAATAMMVEAALVYSLLISALCASIFLVNIKSIKSSYVLTALCWFTLPIGFMATLVIHELNYDMAHNGGPGRDLIYVALSNLPFVIGLGWTYWRYCWDNY